MVVRRSFWEELFAPKIMRVTDVAFGGKRGGARPGSGRKKSRDKLVEEEREKIQDMVFSRKSLLVELHDKEMRDAFINALREAIKGGKAQEKAWALRILAETYLKIPLPKEAFEEEKDTKSIVQQLLDAYNDEISDGLLQDVEIADPAEQTDSAGTETDNPAAEEFLP
jgi:hypothetical protein